MKSNNLSRCLLRSLMVCAFGSMLSGLVLANNIRIIGQPVITNQDTLKKTVLIKFDIAWDNSWKTSKPANYDAAWIFVKCWDGESWNHVYLDEDGLVPGSTNAADAVNKGKVTYSVTDREGKVKNMPMVLEAGYSMAWKQWHLDPTEEAVKCIVGYFLYRKDFGAGHVVVPGVTFKWNYGNQGFVDEDDLVVKVFAVEMVYVPAGSYYLGGKGTEQWQHASFTTNGDKFGTPMVITSENAITVRNSADKTTLWAINNGMTEGTIPAAYPKGYQAFYIMKYEMTQEAYCEFLNTLNQGQQDGRIQGILANLGVGSWAAGSDIRHLRNYVKIKQAAPVAIFGMDANANGVFNETDKVKYDDRDTLIRNIDGQDLAVNYVSMYDLLAYAEFAGLRPMTELEYEKACRGPREPVNDEYAWGSVTKVLFCWSWNSNGQWQNHNGRIWNPNTGTERVDPAYNAGLTSGKTWGGSACWWGRYNEYSYAGVFRVGMFADSTTTRAASGATFWGVMNMSDNAMEMCISAYDTAGRNFIGSHGSGLLDGNGDAINEDWNIVSTPSYFIPRGILGWSWWWPSTCTGPRDGNEIYWNEAGQNYWDYWLGMVSTRGMVAHTISPLTRDYNINSRADGVRGIRCVRTQNALK
ncbi:MAG: SUMF1/EgtB/PvdO family nonheme iron enzyme [Bacteroides sp.]|nr:SUMF1/EgtB/PvdO family nonheme iron enzyme [Bacteroides sp.]